MFAVGVQSAVLIALRRVFSSCSSGWLVGSEVVGCWAESLANQQRIAKGPGSKDWDPGPAKRAQGGWKWDRKETEFYYWQR
jgi:hypothetical protein